MQNEYSKRYGGKINTSFLLGKKMAEEKIRQMIRLFNTDILGDEPLVNALRRIKGIGFSFSSAICNTLSLDRQRKIGSLSDAEIKKLEEVIKNPTKYDIPPWMLNRQKDYDTGENMHIVEADLKFKKEFDIKYMKKIKCYKGVRHSQGLPVRGQRTKAHFRHGKSVGVRKKAKVGKK